MSQILRTGTLTIAWLVVLACFATTCSAMFFVGPWLRIYAVDVVPNHATWVLVACLAPLVVALWAHRRRGTGNTRALIGIASLATLLAAIMVVRLWAVAYHENVRISLLQTFSWRGYSQTGRPDESRIYSRPQGEPLWLDVYRARRTVAAVPTPALVVVHGGAFSRGSRTMGAANMRWYADRGVTVISIDYRLARPNRPTWDLAGRDVECALAWTATHASDLHIDLNKIIISGASAGGSLAMAAAYATPGQRQDPVCGPLVPKIAAVVVKVPLVTPSASWTHPGEMNAIQRRILRRYLGGSPEQFPQRYAAVDIMRYPRRGLPPTLILGGDSDSLVPPESASAFTARATAAGSDVRHVLFPYSGHNFNTTFGSITNQAVLDIVERFIGEHA